MSVDVEAHDLERFRAIISTRIGLQFDEEKLGCLGEVLRRRLEASGQGVDSYISRLDGPLCREELGSLARELTVPETYFFRHIDQYRALKEVVLLERFASQATSKRLTIHSLGCASGEEAYSLAILVRDTLPDSTWDVSIVGIDVNPAIIDKARRARFSAWALRETPERDRLRWFRADGRDFVLDDGLRACVRFEERNLVEDDPYFWQHETCDVVFCRNVIMYFAPEQAQALIQRIVRVLRPGGYLFLGHAETLRGLSNDFHLCHTHGTFYYRRKEDVAQASSHLGHVSESRSASSAALAELAGAADSWVDAIRRASERVAALTQSRHNAQAEPRSATAVAKRSWDLSVVLELLRHERFSQALATMDALPPESGEDTDVLLLRAVLLAHGGQFKAAEGVCARLLEVDELSAGAHYLLALCREGVGDTAHATYHDQVAAYLDPGFAMPRLHRGLLARRAGDEAVARRELGHALVLLQREDASRVLLFGGGFGREALVTLCCAELVKCGGTL
jgi:chemotaxis protein methyltransferase CheR